MPKLYELSKDFFQFCPVFVFNFFRIFIFGKVATLKPSKNLLHCARYLLDSTRWLLDSQNLSQNTFKKISKITLCVIFIKPRKSKKESSENPKENRHNRLFFFKRAATKFLKLSVSAPYLLSKSTPFDHLLIYWTKFVIQLNK
jgi:hypothetical protein